jgi:hypothetical protein
MLLLCMGYIYIGCYCLYIIYMWWWCCRFTRNENDNTSTVAFFYSLFVLLQFGIFRYVRRMESFKSQALPSKHNSKKEFMLSIRVKKWLRLIHNSFRQEIKGFAGVFGVTSDKYLNYAIQNRQEWEKNGREEIVLAMIDRIQNPNQGGESEVRISNKYIWPIKVPKKMRNQPTVMNKFNSENIPCSASSYIHQSNVHVKFILLVSTWHVSYFLVRLCQLRSVRAPTG